MEVETLSFSLPLAHPLRTAAGTIERRDGVAVRVRGEHGVGVGEATPLPGWTESLEDCSRSLAAIESPTEALDQGTLDGHPAARHGLSLALADYRARLDREPLSRHLGGDRTVDRIPVNATVGDGDPTETVMDAKEAVANGFSALKIKVGCRSVEADVDRVQSVRDAVGPGVELRCDANGAWTRIDALRAMDALADVDVTIVEQPLEPDDIDGHERLRGGPVRVALDETLAGRTPDDIDACLTATDVLVLKPMVLGGVDRAFEVARRARATGVETVVTTTVDGVIARAAAVHVAATLDDPPACGLATASMLADDQCRDPVPVEHGSIRVPQQAGVGTLGPWDNPPGGEG